MSKKEKFIEEIENSKIELSQEAQEFFDELKVKSTKEGGVTDKGKAILKVMQGKYQLNMNIFKAKDIGEELGISGRSVSGSIRALINGGYVEKVGKEPVTYGLTKLGISYKLDN